MKDNSRPQLISKKCAIENCTFGSNGIITFAELATHYRENHSVTQLLKAGVDIHKVRKKCMSSLERRQVAKFLSDRGLITLTKDIPPEPEQRQIKQAKHRKLTEA